MEYANEIYGNKNGAALFASGAIETLAADAAETAGDRVEISVIAFDYETPTTTGLKIAPNAFAASIKALRDKGRPLPCLYAHDQKMPLGSFPEIINGSRQLRAKGFIDKSLKDAPQALAARKAGALSECSIGFIPLATDWDRDNDNLVILKGRLTEISLVSAGQHPETYVMSAADLPAFLNKKPATPPPAASSGMSAAQFLTLISQQ